MPIIELTGITLWPFKPNWASPVNEIIEWKTDVLTAHAGNEQRRALRIIPRRSFDYQFTAFETSAARLEAMLWVRHAQKFLLPVWADPCKLTGSATATTHAVPCVTGTFGFRAGDLGVIYADEDNYEVFEVASFSGTQINTLDPLTATWTQGMRVFPCVMAHLPVEVPTQRMSSGVLTGQVSFTTGADDTYTYLPDEAATEVYAGLEVVTRQPNWQESISNTFSREFMSADAGVGAVGYYQKSHYQSITRPYQWLLRSRDDILAFRKFIQRMRGQAKTCWVPSWHGDFKPIGENGSSADVTVYGTAFHTFVGSDTTRDRVMVRLVDGTNIYRQITGSAVSGSNTVLTFDNPVDRSTVISICFLMKCRLATDKIVIPWQTAGVATPQLTFTMVPA